MSRIINEQELEALLYRGQPLAPLPSALPFFFSSAIAEIAAEPAALEVEARETDVVLMSIDAARAEKDRFRMETS